MNAIKTAVALVSLASTNIAWAVNSCGFILPPTAASILRQEENCAIKFHTTYGFLNYFYRLPTTPFKTLMSDDTFISTSGGETYFPIEWVEEPRVTIHALDQQVAQPLVLHGMIGLQGRSTLFAQFLPLANAERNDSFSGKLRCITAAGGTDTKSFQAQFCAPLTARGKRDLRTFESVLKAMQPD